MKTKRTFLSILTLCIALLFTACSGKEAASTEKSQDTKTESSSVSTDDSNSKLDNLYQQENQIFADHEDVWNKAFGMMSKSAADQNGNYADYLADTVESNKDSFTDDELKTLTADIETIRKIEEQIAEIEKKNTGSDNTDQKNSSNDASPFKNFSGQDYDGNSVDESLFSKNAVTVINFWFTGCKPCVAELSKLNELNDAIKSMGGEVVGINTETFDGNKTARYPSRYIGNTCIVPALLHELLSPISATTDSIANNPISSMIDKNFISHPLMLQISRIVSITSRTTYSITHTVNVFASV